MKLTKSERVGLQRQASARNGRADSARRARLVVLFADGLTWAEFRPKLDCGNSYTSRWSKRFEAERLAPAKRSRAVYLHALGGLANAQPLVQNVRPKN